MTGAHQETSEPAASAVFLIKLYLIKNVHFTASSHLFMIIDPAAQLCYALCANKTDIYVIQTLLNFCIGNWLYLDIHWICFPDSCVSNKISACLECAVWCRHWVQAGRQCCQFSCRIITKHFQPAATATTTATTPAPGCLTHAFWNLT